MSIFNFWGNKTDVVLYAMPRPFELQICFEDFVNKKLQNIYIAMLQECYKQSKGLDEKQAASLWDNFNYISSNATRGVIRLLAEAMATRSTAFIVYDKATGIARKALGDEQAQIMRDYEEKAKSDIGIACNFNRFYVTDLLKTYLGLLYNTLEAANTQVGLAKAVQVKAKDLRTTQSNDSNNEFIKQARSIVEGVKHGQSVLIDKDDMLELTKTDTKPTQEAVAFYSQLMAGELRVSTSFINGVLTAGMNSTGEAELDTNEDGIENFFTSIFKPACDNLFDVNLEFVTDNYRKIASMVKVLPYLESSEVVTTEQTQDFVNRMLGD